MIDTALLGRVTIESLDRRKHDRASFSCGIAQVDNFLKLNAAAQQDQDATRVYVACLAGTTEILGFYALNSHGIDATTLPEAVRKRLPRYPTVPAIFLSMIGVTTTAQGGGMASLLLADAMRRAAKVADEIGAAFIVLDALNERAAALYRRLGFIDLPSHAPRMVIHMKQVRAALAAAH